MVEEAKLDVLAILTPSHEEHVALAIERRIHVFSEKPLSLNVERSRALYRLAEKADVILETGLMRLHDGALRSIRAKVREHHPKSAFFIKCDGSDASRRREMLPDGFDTYSFNDRLVPDVPAGLSERQTAVLKQLLWSGAHLLTALVDLFPGAQARDTFLTDSGAIHCTFTGNDDEVLRLSLLVTRVPAYFEEVRLIGGRWLGLMEFDSPYQHPGRSRTTSYEGETDVVETHREFRQSPFRRMWESLHQRIAAFQQHDAGANAVPLECQIEELALDAARLAS
jgi:hypothetical protein